MDDAHLKGYLKQLKKDYLAKTHRIHTAAAMSTGTDSTSGDDWLIDYTIWYILCKMFVCDIAHADNVVEQIN